MTIISYQVLVGDTSNKPIYTLRKSISVHLRIQNYIYIQYVRSSGSGEIWYPFHPATGVETLAACQSHINGTCVPFSLYIYISYRTLVVVVYTHTLYVSHTHSFIPSRTSHAVRRIPFPVHPNWSLVRNMINPWGHGRPNKSNNPYRTMSC